MIILTKHAKERYKERICTGHYSDTLLQLVAEEVYEYGKLPIQFYDTNQKLYQYLIKIQSCHKTGKCFLKVLKDNIFIFIKEDVVKLITCYKLNEKNIYNIK